MCGHGIVTEPPIQLEVFETYRQSPKDEIQSKTYLVDYNTEFGPPPGSVEQILNRPNEPGSQLNVCQNYHVSREGWQSSKENFSEPVGQGLDDTTRQLEEWRWVPRTAKNAWWRDTEICDSRFTQKPACAGERIFSELFRTMFLSGIKRCNSARCRVSWAAYEAAAPQCRWAGFRDFMITMASCQLPKDQLFAVDRAFLSPLLAPSLISLQGPMCLDIKGVMELFLWATRLMEGESGRGLAPIPDNDETAVGLREFLRPEYEALALEQTTKCQKRGICPNRLWNISSLCERGVFDVVSLAEIALKAPKLNLNGSHKGCTPQLCELGEVNSTRVRQGHKCKSGDCQDEIEFPPELLNSLFHRSENSLEPPKWQNTAWKLGIGFTLCSEIPPRYMAVSHVWSDGTGVGTKPAGQVNRCLHNYFAQFAWTLGCDGIWWDTICMPTDRSARSLALASMLQNYQRAKVTLVHDEDLVKFGWRDDGSPAVALVLSSWFTRGWTAAELWASQGHAMKIAFGNPDDPNGMPLIKDLDQDVLAHDHVDLENTHQALAVPERCVARLGHFVATDIVRMLRPNNQELSPSTLQHTSWLQILLQILRHRTTSWVRDRMIIAGLISLTEGNMDPEWTGQQITHNILATAPALPVTFFIHDEVTIANSGPWSWCPRSIFDLGKFMSNDTGTFPQARVFPSGEMMVTLDAFEVRPTDVMIPCGSHPFLAAQVSHAKTNARYSLLLASKSMQSRRLYILFQPCLVYFHSKDPVVEGYWMACVTLQTSLEAVGPTQGVDRSARRSLASLRIVFGGDLGGSSDRMPGLSFEAVRSAVTVLKGTRCSGSTMNRLLAIDSKERKGEKQVCTRLYLRSWCFMLSFLHGQNTRSRSYWKDC